MALRIAVQMDPLETVNIDADSTFALMLEAQRRGHSLVEYHPDALTYDRGAVRARVRPVEVQREVGNHATFGAAETIALGTDSDVVLMRQDPPFDMQYIAATHLLESIHGVGANRTFCVNHPSHVRNAPEKIFVTEFAEFMPPTMISRDVADITAFRDEHRDIIVKPLFGNGGAGVFHLKPDDENLTSLLETLLISSREQLMIQAYLPAIRAGDKRIILVDGEPIGAINRIPADGEARANLHVGGRAEPVALTEREREICAALGLVLKARDLIFVGIDVIGDSLTEINVTSPTGLQELQRFDGTDGPALIWDAIERRFA
ncbi:MAG: glutathione synthase [Alphaproteobacteria bacterium]